MRKWLLSAVVIGLLVSLSVVSMAADNSGLKDLEGHWSEAQVTKAVKTGSTDIRTRLSGRRKPLPGRSLRKWPLRRTG